MAMKRDGIARFTGPVLLTTAVVALSWTLLGPIPGLTIATGYVGGLGLWLWCGRRPINFASIRIPFWLTLGLFLAHKVEERTMDFFPALEQVTGYPVLQEITLAGFALYLLASAWLLAPVLMKRHKAFGAFLAWSFFCSMGVAELTHFLFPLLRSQPYGYFPGMATVVLLAPAGWWGLKRMIASRCAAPCESYTHHACTETVQPRGSANEHQ